MICFRTPAALQSGLTPRRVTRTLQTLAAVRPAPARYHGITAPAIRSSEHARTPGIVMNVMDFSDCRRQFGDLHSSRAVSRFRVRPTPPFFSVARFSVVLCGHPRHAAVSVLAGEERQMDDWQRNGLNGSGGPQRGETHIMWYNVSATARQSHQDDNSRCLSCPALSDCITIEAPA